MAEELKSLDKLAAKYSQKMVTAAAGKMGVFERLVTKTLGVLQQQGVYAMMLFLFSRTGEEKSVSPHVRKHLYAILRNLDILPDRDAIPGAGADPKTALNFYIDHLLEDLSNLLLVRDLYEQTLIYARYGAKAVGD